MNVRRLAVVALGALFLGSCTGEIMSSHRYIHGADTYFTAGASPGKMLTVVVGNPFPGVSKATLDKAVLTALTDNHYGPRTQFVTDPRMAPQPKYRVVVAFNTPRSFDSSGLCGDTAAIPSEPQGKNRLHALVGFCVGPRLYTDTYISIPTADSPSDPRFDHMLASAMWELIPSPDPFEADNNCKLPYGCNS